MNSTRFICPTPDVTEATTGEEEPTQQNCDFRVQHRDLQNNIQVRVQTKRSIVSKEQFLIENHYGFASNYGKCYFKYFEAIRVACFLHIIEKTIQNKDKCGHTADY